MHYGLDSEYARLTKVLLFQPGAEVGNHPDPAAIQQLRPIDTALLAKEAALVGDTFTCLGVQVTQIDPTPLTPERAYLYNMMFCRDLFLMTPLGAIMARMAHEIRRGEVQYAARTLKRIGVPIFHQIDGDGRFEGADALWINRKLVAVGVGNRTNMAAFTQIRQILSTDGIDCVPLPSCQTTTQHLLGSLQLVDRNLALVRNGITAPEITTFLEKHGFTVINIPENSEVTTRQAMNIVTVAPRHIIMTAGCPLTKQLFQAAGLTVVAELAISQLINGAGGLACATGILARNSS
ncbi:MAG: hypothetical protein CVU66_02285 [Deltaproteobacteria bacterium HGW-Deltaproteobacteria-23]|nr:MAG: hypothetical protein CVU66_02285 [Deltaproteobacteria bacterium HGW-Deltaproteobacteria-23]